MRYFNRPSQTHSPEIEAELFGAPVLPIHQWHSKELAKRIARADAEPSTSIPLEQLRAELLPESK